MQAGRGPNTVTQSGHRDSDSHLRERCGLCLQPQLRGPHPRLQRALSCFSIPTMAVFGLFSKRDKHKASIDASASDTQSVNTDFASTSGQPTPRNGHALYGGPVGASSSKLMLGFGGKKSKPSQQTDDNGYLRPPPSVLPKLRLSSSKSESGHESLGPPPSRSDLFASYGGANVARSTQSLPTTTTAEPGSSRQGLDNAGRISSTPDVKKPKGMFSWAHRERKKSKPPPPDASLVSPDESFNLKSFRHVRPASPSPTDLAPRPPSSLSTSGLTPPLASTDSSQRISVAAFREMAARRSAANSPSPSSVDLRGDGSPFLRPPSSFTQGMASPSPPPPSFRRPKPTSPTSDSTSSESESDEDGDSAGSSTLRPKRRGPTGTITPRSAGKSASELGQVAKPTPPRMRASPSAQSNASDRGSLYNRARASQSTSALMPNAAAQRASAMHAAQNANSNDGGVARKVPSKVVDSDSDSTSDSDSDTDSDDAPLASRVLGHRRTGSGTSTATAATNVSRARMLPKPLIDISGLAPPSLPPLETDKSPLSLPRPASQEPKEESDKENAKVTETQEAPKDPEREKASPSSSAAAKPSLNDRLARLAASVSNGRSNTLANPDEAEKANADRGRSPGPLVQPTRSQTLPVEAIVTNTSPCSSLPMPSSSPTKTKPNGRSYSTSNAYEIQDLSDPKPIVPTPIRERSPPPAFSVTSRPASQMSLASHVHFVTSWPSNSPPLTTAQARLTLGRTPSPATITSQSPTEMRSPIDLQPRPESRPRSESRTNSSPSILQKPLIPDHGLPPSKGFTGSGLLASTGAATEAGRASPASASSNSTAPSRARHNQEPTAAPKPVRPRQFVPPVSTSSESSQTSASTSASSPRVAAPPAISTAQQRARARTMEASRDGVGNVSPGTLASMPPVRPFAGGVRGYSPASSTGESSSGRTPITPQDGSELSFSTRERAREKERPQGTGPGASAAAARRGHRKSSSLTFAELEGQRGRAGLADRERETKEKEREKSAEDANAESRRRQRRRSEAKAALELGKIVNGRPPTDDDDDEDRPLDNMPPRMSMMNNMTGVSPTGHMNMNMNMMSSPMPWTNQPSGMMSPQPFMFPPVPPNADPTFLAAHQQAMMFAKQAYQMAVAQQAMAAAEEEWERGSTGATSMLNGGGGHTSTAQSMYAGSVAGSELGVGGRGQGWGSRSAYGDPSAGERTSTFRGSTYGVQPPGMPPRTVSSGSVQTTPQRPGPRPRTRTDPSVPVRSGKREPVPPPLPPSSWKSAARQA
ncbi:uncharacterized protein B0H18DRAFT_1005838 [Fomitopsis serialis]|uniref:uncharacterized protein n=1 Tax=Fomitopsis serialis TaxID=139415 RepID=UPI00200737A1|nr:uncharacterized protein B0H18DRAFT_1005838 [Neoantrodia serialis]KAH9926389.1 hypothetical protein B0H18DRAFT_1005838 [Neoantrodia serialis]